jgi:hypothetical protein
MIGQASVSNGLPSIFVTPINAIPKASYKACSRTEKTTRKKPVLNTALDVAMRTFETQPGKR